MDGWMKEVEFNTQVVPKYTATHTLLPKNKIKLLFTKQALLVTLIYNQNIT